MIRVQQEDFDVGIEYKRLTDALPVAGAVIAFVGRVRDMTDKTEAQPPKQRINTMTLEHYPGMTEKELAAIEARAHDRWPLMGTVIIHRFGRLEPGDQIVLVLVSSKHRKDAFQAAEFLIDWLKTKAPFWKLEETPDGENWVDAKRDDDEAVKRWM